MADGLRDMGITEPGVVLVNDENGRQIAKVVNGAEAIQAPQVELKEGDEAPTQLGPGLEIAVQNEMVVPSVAGDSHYYTPVGAYFLDASGETTLEVDQGSGFVPVAFGPGYTHRGRFSVPASVVDAKIGFRYEVGAVLAGWTFRFRWLERRISIPPIAIGKARVTVGGAIDYSVRADSNSVNAPNGVVIPSMKGPSGPYAIEFWRLSRKPSGERAPGILSSGRRYVPYFRGAAGTFIFHKTVFSSTAQKDSRRKYKVCYYNTITGARSALSNDTIVVNNTRADKVGIPTAGAAVRSVASVWIE